MKAFELISASGRSVATVAVQEYRESLWCAAFGVDSLDGLFDMTPVEQAKPLIDAAISAFVRDPDGLRGLLSSEDPLGLRGNRQAFLDLRERMVRLGGVISGAVEVE